MSESPNWSNPLRDSRDLRLPRIAGPCSLVIFGVTGDLAQKKLLPAVYDLANRGLLPPSFGLTGFARRDWTQERFIEFVKAAVRAHCRTPFKESTWRNLAAGIRFVQGTFDDPEAFERLSATVQELDRDRIGGRAGYYDGIGAARDVIQNHLLQLMALTAMEEPVSFTAKDLTAEKTKVLSAVRLPKDLAANTARGQYAKGWQGSHEVVGYLEEKGIDPKSTTETYAAIRLDIDTRRWAGVPFYLRCGKRLGKRVTEIAVAFKRAPHLPFEQTAVRELGKNAIVIRVQPDEGVTMRFGAKVPGGSTMEVRDVNMDFSYGRSFTENSPEAYERLILDVLLGDPPLFPTTEEVNLSWEILDPIEQFWSTLGQPQAYRAGTWGPAQADEMLARDGRHWRMP